MNNPEGKTLVELLKDNLQQFCETYDVPPNNLANAVFVIAGEMVKDKQAQGYQPEACFRMIRDHYARARITGLEGLGVKRSGRTMIFTPDAGRKDET